LGWWWHRKFLFCTVFALHSLFSRFYYSSDYSKYILLSYSFLCAPHSMRMFQQWMPRDKLENLKPCVWTPMKRASHVEVYIGRFLLPTLQVSPSTKR
jgi:hypothetical protein